MNLVESSQSEGCCMAFTPQSGPTKGGEVLFITYSDDFPLPSTAEFFLVFEGSSQRHVTTTQQINAYTIQAVAPRHDKAETVSLTVHCFKDGTAGLLSSHRFNYNLETEKILADLLSQHVSNPQFLQLCVSLCSKSNNISGETREILDSRFTEAFKQLELSPSWTLLGEGNQRNGLDNGLETLLHLAAHLGFSQLAMCLLDKPGADDALVVLDRTGKSPIDIANDKGLTKLADAFAKGANAMNEQSLDSDKPHATKTEIGTTTISSYMKYNKNTIEKDIDMLREMQNMVKDELNRKKMVFKHSWPGVQASSRSSEDKSSTNDSTEHLSGRGDILRMKAPSSNRQLLEQNLKRLRDINEEIQRLRVTSQRNNRESSKDPADKRPIRRLSCPSFRGQDILAAHMMIGKVVPSDERPMVQKPCNDSGDEQLLGVVESPDMRRLSWGDKTDDQTKPEYKRRVSSSLDDLTSPGPVKKAKDPLRSRTQVIELPKHLTKEQECNRLADIIDSIKSEEKKDDSKIQNRSATSVSMQGKSYSYSCLASLPLDDGVDSGLSGESSVGDERTTNGHKAGTNEEMSLLDFLSHNDPDDSAEDSEEPTEKDKPSQEKGTIRRFSMLFGSKSARHSKRELPKPGHSKSRERSSMRKEKGQSMINLSVKDAEFKDKTDNTKDINSKTAIGRRASGLSNRGSKLGEGPTLPNPGMLTKMASPGNKLSTSHSFKSTSPLPFRKSLNPSQGDEGDDKSISGVSLEGSGDEDIDDDGVFAREYDSDMELKDEADAWSLTVDKMILKKMNAKDIKRQDVIHELMQTEEHYVVTLKIMFKIFYSGMIKDLHLPKDTVNSIFPQVEKLLDLHSNFLNSMKAKENSQTIVERIGDVLENQFSGSIGDRMKEAYGDFCSHHIEAVALYKKLHKNDKKFADFVKKCSVNKICRRLSIPECITLVTQRLTKYPLLFEAIIKTTKEMKPDHPSLKNAVKLVKGVLYSVDNSIKEYEKQKTLQDIKMRMDLKVAIAYKGNKKVKNIDFASNSSSLLHEGMLLWKTARGKFVECVVLILDDMLVFLQEKDQKYSLLSLDQKAPVIRLNNLFVREVATDTKAIFLVSTSKEGPEMYEMVCGTPSEKKMWIRNIKDAIASAPKDKGTGELITTKAGEMRKHLLQRASTLMEEVQNAEPELQNMYLLDIQDLIAKLETEEASMKGNAKEDLTKTRESLVKVMNQLQTLASEESGEDQFSENSMSLSSSSGDVGFKRAETFSGFDNKQKLSNADQAVTRAYSMKTERTVNIKNYDRPDTTVSTSDQGSPASKHKRKGSGGGLSFRNKNRDDKKSTDTKADLASSSTSSSPVNTPNQEQMECQDDNEGITETNSDSKDVIYF